MVLFAQPALGPRSATPEPSIRGQAVKAADSFKSSTAASAAPFTYTLVIAAVACRSLAKLGTPPQASA